MKCAKAKGRRAEKEPGSVFDDLEDVALLFLAARGGHQGTDRRGVRSTLADHLAEVLLGDAQLENVRVILSPSDLRKAYSSDAQTDEPFWVEELYAAIRRELRALPPRRR